jgi:hypothetical protein
MKAKKGPSRQALGWFSQQRLGRTIHGQRALNHGRIVGLCQNVTNPALRRIVTRRSRRARIMIVRFALVCLRRTLGEQSLPGRTGISMRLRQRALAEMPRFRADQLADVQREKCEQQEWMSD